MNGKRITAIALLLIIALFGWCRADNVTGDLTERFKDIPRIEHGGTVYKMRNRLTTVLLIGVDRETGTEKRFENYRSGGQADFIMLLVIDDNRDRITPIMINRDTLAEITVMNIRGEEAGTAIAQICLSHGYGDGGAQSCELTARAVRKLMRDLPIDHYIAMNMDAIGALNDLIGGVEVTLTDSFTAYDPTMTAGTTLRLQGKQAEYYLRYRYSVGDQTNRSRAKRQTAYINAAKDIVMQKISESPNYAGTVFDALKDSLVTDMHRGAIINLANKVRNYTVMPIAQPDGEWGMSEDGYVEFRADADSITEIVLDACYVPE